MGELYVSAEDEGSTHNAVVRWHATTGWEVRDSQVIVDDEGNITTPGTITYRDRNKFAVGVIITGGALKFTGSLQTIDFTSGVVNSITSEGNILLVAGNNFDSALLASGSGKCTARNDGTDREIVTISGTQTLTNKTLTLTDDMTITDKNIILGTTTGTKIGTATSQKLGFYNVTPVDQPATVSDPSNSNLTGFDSVNKTNLSSNLQNLRTAVEAIIDRLQELGLIA